MNTPVTPQPPASEVASPEGEVSAAEITRWFVNEVHPHELQLRNYLKVSFPRENDFDDVVQESYLRIWRSRAVRPIQSTKAFLFKIARHVALDRLRRNHISPVRIGVDTGLQTAIDATADIVEAVTAAERIQLFTRILAKLPARSREVLILCKLQGLSHREAAERLGIAERTVDEHLLRAMKRFGQHVRQQGLRSLYRP